MSVEFTRVVLIGHDAFPAGAQHLLLAIGETLRRRFGMEIRFVLIGGGELTERYRLLAPTFVADERPDPWARLRAHLAELRAEGFGHALTNTTAAGGVTPILREFGFAFCSLVHELPTVVAARALEPTYKDMLRLSPTIVYPNNYVKARLDAAFGEAKSKAMIRGQGVYQLPAAPKDCRSALRSQLGLADDDQIVLNLGYADLRKGIDLFVAIAERAAASDSRIHFVWAGGVHPDVEPWLTLDLKQRGLRNVHMRPFTKDVGRYLGAADLFLLTSREDPFPSVVLEALSVGLPVVAFEGAGGHSEMLDGDARLGRLTRYGDAGEAARAILQVLGDADLSSEASADYRRKFISERFDFGSYCADLLGWVEPSHKTVSVVVPNYDYACYLPERLGSVFEQTYPLFEILFLDDASHDESLAVAEAVARQAGRVVEMRPRARNSGNVFRQWKAGLDRAKGEFVWIAEADDSSTPRFLATAARRLAADPDAAFCFTDSRSIGPEGEAVYDDYKGYYRQYGDHGLDRDASFEARDFLRRFLTVRNHVLNASSVVWRAQALRAVFERLGDEAFQFSCAGDWRIYVEACLAGGSVLYVADPLNVHRRHERSVTHELEKVAHLNEIMRVQDIAASAVAGDQQLERQIAAIRAELREVWNLDPLAAE